jgi:uncharacterized protein
MPKMPEDLLAAWNDREGPTILTTVDGEGRPNSIYVTCVSANKDISILVADNYFDKTRKNILAGCSGSVLFITKAGKAYQIKGPIEYHTSGKVFEDMKTWNPEKHPGHAAVEVKVEQAFSGAKNLL